jgi:hypothetical protein
MSLGAQAGHDDDPPLRPVRRGRRRLALAAALSGIVVLAGVVIVTWPRPPTGIDPNAHGAWVEDTIGAETLDLADLTPPALARALQGLGNDPKSTKTTLGRVSVIRMPHNGTTYYVSARATHRLMRIDGVTGNDAYYEPVGVKPKKIKTVACDRQGCKVRNDVTRTAGRTCTSNRTSAPR